MRRPGEPPKIELHVHLEGTVRPATLLEIARRNDAVLPATTLEELRAWYAYRSISDFFVIWRATTSALRTGEDFRQIAVEYAAEASGHGAGYVEAIFTCSRPMREGRGAEVMAGFAAGADEAYDRFGLLMRFTPDIYRGMELDVALETARHAARYAGRGVVGLGIGGMEGGVPLSDYGEAFAIARDAGLALLPHAGESAGPESVREALTLWPERIRHGVRAVEDADLLTELRERGIVVDVCPTSNVRTGAVSSLAEHPLPQLVEAGVLCSIGTDDPAMFGTDLTAEFAIAERLGVSADAAYRAGLAGAQCDNLRSLLDLD
jgi:aminodeoxyfutalosine deaminase